MKTKRYHHLNWCLLFLVFLLVFPLASCRPAGSQTPSPADSTNLKNLPDPATGLSALSGYRQHLRMTVAGKVKGEDYQSEQSLERQVNGADEAALINQTSTGSDGLYLFIARLGDYRYVQQAQGAACRTEPVQPDRIENLNPALRLPPVFGLKDAGRETLSGQPAWHYTFNAAAVPQQAGKQGKASGDLWVAEENGVVLKYELTIELDEPDFVGTRAWHYELTAVDEDAAIDLPDSCQPVLVDLPMLPDAIEIQNMPGFQRYKAGISRVSAVRFFYDQLTADGWQPLAGTKPENANLSSEVTLLAYTAARGEGGRLLVIQLRDEQGGIGVILQTANTDKPIAASSADGITIPQETDTNDAGTLQAGGGEAALPADLAPYPGAKVVSELTSTLVLQTGDPVEDVIDYYTAVLQDAGWEHFQTSELNGVILQMWARDDETLNITIMDNNGTVLVTLSAG